MKILVTGAAGFIGREVCKQLEKTDYEVYRTDIRKEPGIDYLDITQLDQFVNYLRLKSFGPEDAIINLAAKVAGKPSFKDPYGYFYVNVIGTLNLCEAMKQVGMKYLVYISSWSTFGSKIHLPITEKTEQEPENPYGSSKVACEKIVHSYCDIGFLKSVILRPTMIYGPGQEEANVLQQVVDSMVNETTMELYGEGTHTREFLNVRDASSTMIKSIEVVKKVKTYEIFILGTENPIRIRDLVKKARKISKFPITFKPSSTWAFSQSSDMTKLKHWFGIDPKKDFMTLEEGLRETLQYKRKKQDS